MALIRPAAIRAPRQVVAEEPKEDNIDKILRGMAALKGLTGLAVDVSNIWSGMERRETENIQQEQMRAQQETQARQQAGQFRTAELPGAGLIEVPEAEKGLLGVRQITVDEQPTFVMGQPQFQVRKKQEGIERAKKALAQEIERKKQESLKVKAENEVTQSDADLKEFTKVVAKPSSRDITGRYQIDIDIADRGLTMIARIADKVRKENNLPNASDEEALNLFTTQDGAEILSDLTRTLTGTTSVTDSQREHIDVSSVGSRIADFKQWLTANPTGAGLGKFLNRWTQTLVAIRNQVIEDKRDAFNALAAGYPLVEKHHPDRMNFILEKRMEKPIPKYDTREWLQERLKVGEIRKAGAPLFVEDQDKEFNPDSLIEELKNARR